MGLKKYKMIKPPMNVVTVTLPTSDTKKVLVVLLHVSVQRIVVVRRKCTEGAQQSLLCVHTSNMGIHSDFNALNAMYVEDVGDGVCGFYATLYAEYTLYTVAPRPARREGSL